jgi:cell division protease FtsH
MTNNRKQDMNANPKRPGPPSGNSWKKTGGTVTFWVLVLMIMVFLSRAFDDKPVQQELPYTEYVQLLQQDQLVVSSLTVISDSVTPLLVGELRESRLISDAQGDHEYTSFRVHLPSDYTADMAMWTEKGIPFDFQERQTNWLAYMATTILPWILILGIWIFIMRRMQGGGGGNKGVFSFGKSRAKMMNDDQITVSFKDVAGAEEAKEELAEVIEFLRDPKKFSRLGGRIPKGALMLGPPGTGKTLLARAVAGEAKVPFFSMSGADFVEMFVGVGASRVRDLFEQGKKNAPCILFIDEIDAVGRQRGAGLGGGHDEREQTLNQLLVEMDGFESNEGVILIAATNRPDVLDPALLRPGRFDRQIVVDRPDVRGREGILKVHVKKVPLAEDVDLKIVAKGTPGLAGADLANIVNEAALLAARHNLDVVGMDEFEEARDKVLMGTARKSLVLTDEDKKITAWHEAGHALVGSLLKHADAVHKVTIIPRGRALGLTWQLPEDKVHQNKSQLLAAIRVLLAGREAEALVFNEISTGASNDIQRVTQIAQSIVCELGMSEKMGMRNYGKKQEEIFIGREIAQHRDFSEHTAEMIDQEIDAIISEARKETAALLLENRDTLDAIAEALLEREILDAADIKCLLVGEELPPIKTQVDTSASDTTENADESIETKASSEPNAPIKSDDSGVEESLKEESA